MASIHKTQLRLQQSSGSLVDLAYSGSQSSAASAAAVDETNLAGVLGQFAGAIGRITGKTGTGASAFTNQSAGVFSTTIVPDSPGAQDMGSASAEWGDVYIGDKSLYIGAGQEAEIGDQGGSLSIRSSEPIGIGDNAVAAKISVGGDTATRTEVEINAIVVDINGGATGITIDALDAGSIDIGTSAVGASDTSAVNIGTSATARTITVGNDASTKVDVNALAIELDSAGTIVLNSTTTTTLDSTAGMSLDAGAASNFTTSAGALTLAGASLDIDASGGAADIDATTTITMGGTSATQVNLGRSGKDTIVFGNLQVQGTTTTVSSSNVTFKDSLIGLGYSGSNTPGAAGDRGVLFGRSTNVYDAQPTLWYDGTNFALGTTITAPNSGSVGSVSAYLGLKSGDLDPGVDNTYALGSTTLQWSDLFLSDAGVINVNNGNSTLTGGSSLWQSNVPIRATKLEIDSANDYIDVSTDLQIVAAADIDLRAAGAEINVRGGGTNDFLHLHRASTTAGYLNFTTDDSSAEPTNGQSGFGFRNSGGTMQFKDSGGSWTSFATSDATDRFTASITKTVTSGSSVVSSSAGLSSFDLSDLTDARIQKQVDVFINGQLMLSGSDANVGAGSADYLVITAPRAASDVKFGFSLQLDDVLQITVR